MGGTIVVGVPEGQEGLPEKLQGIEIDPQFESRVENLIVDAISPVLPELRVVRVPLIQEPSRAVYLIWVPQSWLGPHIVEGFNEERYYRRSDRRSVPMRQDEVWEKYQQRQRVRAPAEALLQSQEMTYLREFLPRDRWVTHFAAVPLVLVQNRISFNSSSALNWLRQNPYPGARTWSLSSLGACNRHPHDIDRALYQAGNAYAEVFASGAISVWRTAVISASNSGGDVYDYRSDLPELLFFLRTAGSFYSFQKYLGPVILRLRIEFNGSNETSMRRLLLPRVRRDPRSHIPLVTPDGFVTIRLEPSAAQMIAEPKVVHKAFADGLFNAFGLLEADWFDEELNLIP